MKITYLDIEELNIRDGVNYHLTPVGLFSGDKEIIFNDIYSDGQSFNRSKIKEKRIVLQGYIKGDILNNLWTLKQILFRPGLKKLTIGIEGMPMFYCMVELENWISEELNPEIISCQLVAPDPFFYEVYTGSVSLGAVSNTSVKFPITFPITFGEVTAGQGIVPNNGNATAYPIINITGTCDSIVITNNTTGESMTLNVSLGARDTLVIDNRPKYRGITLNGVNRMDLKQGDWLSCIIGDNTFSFMRNSLESKRHCLIILQSRWT